jgi:hypothetical protein
MTITNISEELDRRELLLPQNYPSSATKKLSAVNVPAKTLKATFWITGGDSIHYTVRWVPFSRIELLLHNREAQASNLGQETSYPY